MRCTTFCVLLTLLLASGKNTDAFAQQSRAPAANPQAAKSSMAEHLYPLFQNVLLLRQALTDGSAGVAQALTTPKAAQIMAAIDAGPLQGFDTAAVWSYLFSTSVFAVGGGGGARPVAAFYHPYADVFALTEWEQGQDGWRMTDFELLPGDWLRTGGKGTMDLKPLWRRGKTAAADALVLAVRDSIAAFETNFPPTGDSTGWRQRLNLGQPEVAAAMAQAPAALLLMECLQRLGELRAPQNNEDPGFALVRPRSEAFIALATGALWNNIFAACPETGPQTRKALIKFPKGALTGLAPVFVDLTDAGGFIVYQRPQVADGVLVLTMAGKEKRYVAKRLDFVFFPAITLHKATGGKK